MKVWMLRKTKWGIYILLISGEKYHMARKHEGNIAIDLHQCLLRKDLYFSIALMCMSNVIMLSPIIGNRDIFRCMGGKTHVMCQCKNMHFISTNTWHEAKQKCIICHRLDFLSVVVFHILPVYAKKVIMLSKHWWCYYHWFCWSCHW